jgi:hypothetical protein
MAADMIQPQEPLKHPCIKCGHETNHLILAIERTIDPDPDFGSEDRYMLVRCQGCGSISFRNEYDNSQDMFVTEEGDLEQNTKVTVHPPILEGHRELGACRTLTVGASGKS